MVRRDKVRKEVDMGKAIRDVIEGCRQHSVLEEILSEWAGLMLEGRRKEDRKKEIRS